MRLALLFIALSTPALAAPFCADDAAMRAGALLKLHWNMEDAVLADLPGAPLDTGDAQAWDISEAVEVAPVRALAVDGMFDVLEVNGYVYKATYRMRFIYAQIPDVCVLMGQELLEVADPY